MTSSISWQTRSGSAAGQVDLIDDRQDLQTVIHRQIAVGKGLRLDALRGIDDEDRALTGGKRPADFIVEVHVTGGIDQIERGRSRRYPPCNPVRRRAP